MSDSKNIDNVIPFPGSAQPKLGLKKAVRKKEAVMERLGQLSMFPGDEPDTAPRLADVLKLPTNSSVFEEALVMDERGLDEAEAMYRKAIDEDNYVADAYCNLGIIQHRREETAKAFDSFTRSLEVDPRHFESHFNLGNLYFETGDLRLAKLHYDLALEVDDEFANLHFNLGLLYALEEDFGAALVQLKLYRAQHEGDDAVADDLIARLERLDG